MSIQSRILLAGFASVFALTACNSNNSGQSNVPGKNGVAAVVNGTPIRESLVELMVKQRADLGRPVTAETRNMYIDRLALQLVIAQEAVKKGLDKAPGMADQLELNRQALLVNAFVQDYLKGNPISDDMVKAEYEKIKTQKAGTEYKARHILVENEADAKDIIARLKKNPEVFEALAKEKSKDTSSKTRGGDLGWFDPRNTVPEFSAAVAKLAKGTFSEEAVKSQFGYHVILLEDSRPKEIQPLERIKPELMQQMQKQNLDKLFEELKAKAKIEIAQAPASSPATEAKPAEPAKK